jgi:serine phosphatase RsbU (regulator of sigma subunit)/HAMP domain-containing protein
MDSLKLTLRTKFIFLSLFLVSVIMITVIYFFTISELQGKRQAIESQSRRIAENIATLQLQLLDRQDWNVYQNYITQLLAFNKDIVYIAIYDDRKTLRAHALNLELIEMASVSPSRRIQAEIVKQLDSGAIAEESREDLHGQRVDIQVGNRILGNVSVGFSLVQINQDLSQQVKLNIALGIFFLIVLSGASIFVSGRLTRPLEKLSGAMSAVAAGDLTQNIEIYTGDEIGHLSRNFNEMVEGLRERKIFESLGNELSGTFRLTDLANIVRERISAAIGACDARLYIKNRELPDKFDEITAPQQQKDHLPIINIDENTKAYLLGNTNGFMINSAPEFVLESLKYHRSHKDSLILPMTIKEELFGILLFTLTENQNSFSAKQQHFAFILSNQAAIALENAMLYEGVKEQERIKRELEIAREVQQKLLPRQMPKIKGFEIDGICQSAQEVGGDYFDFFQLDENNLGIVVADVSGKGTSASFYMAEVKGMMMQLCFQNISPRQVLIEINRRLYNDLDRRMFVTLIYGILNTSKATFTFCRAGHNAALHLGNESSKQFLTPSGIGLGLDPGELFNDKLEEMCICLRKDDLLLLYTDGVTEAMNQRQEEYGEKRLFTCLKSIKAKNVIEQKKELLDSIHNFINDQPQHDDITMVFIKNCLNK